MVRSDAPEFTTPFGSAGRYDRRTIPLHDHPAPPAVSRPALRRLASFSVIAVVAASGIGLLCMRIHPYDDALLLVGAQLIRAGELPYRDFYTHYGPLGYSIQAFFSGFFGNPPVALRIGQTLFLSFLAALAVVAARRFRLHRPAAAVATAAAVVLAVSSAAPLASFYGFALVLAALGSGVVAENTHSRSLATAWAVSSGLLFAAAALTRPAFAMYGVVALLVVTAATPRHQWGLRTATIGALLAGMAILWLGLYRDISLSDAFEATIQVPRRLMSGGARYRAAPFLRAPLPLAFTLSTLLAVPPLIWAAAASDRRTRVMAVLGFGLAGAAPLWLRFSHQPAKDIMMVAAVLPILVGALILRERRALAASGAQRGAALFCLAAALFGHYFWSRADQPHLVPYLAVASVGVAMSLGALRPRWRWAVFAILLVDYPLFFRPPGDVLFPVEELAHGGRSAVSRLRSGTARGWGALPSGDVEADAARAVALADQNAAPSSRFVAVASSHAVTDQDPVQLFLLSSRLPYTRWFQYDPGLQGSPRIQQEMIEELMRSQSLTAVVWRTEAWMLEPLDRPLPPTPFDEAFDRLYPVVIARVGLFEVRRRAEDGLPAGSPPR